MEASPLFPNNKRFFHNQRDGGFGTPNQEPKRTHTFKTAASARDDIRGLALNPMLEPFLRKLVSEETERVVSKLFPSSSSCTANEAETSTESSLQLLFANKLPSRIFTNSTLKADDGSLLRVILYDANSKTIVKSGPLSSAKIDIVVLTGLFSVGGEDWTEEEFDSKTLRERNGKRPLIAGSQSIVLTNGVGFISDISITDNSSWIPNKKFILGAKISQKKLGRQRVKEAKSHPFSVKDSRGEGYTKHYPPSLQDEVWRLVKIRKDGKFHERLTSHGILTVKDFLQWNETDQPLLRDLLGRMSDKIWRKILNHAKTCINDCTIFKIQYGGHEAPMKDLNQPLPAYMNRFEEQPAAQQALTTYQQANHFAAPNLDFPQLEPTSIHLQEYLQSQDSNINSNEENGTELIFQLPKHQTDSDSAFTSTLGPNYVLDDDDVTFKYSTASAYCFPPPLPPTTMGQAHDFLLTSSCLRYGFEAPEHGIFPC